VSLFDKWNDYAKKLGLTLDEYQILGDWKRERDQLKAQLQQSQERGAAVKKAFEAWSDEPNWVCDEFDELCGAIEALYSPS